MSETQSEKAQEVLSKPAADTKPEASLQVDAEMEEEQREQVRQVVTSVMSEFSGPLPPPSIMKGYEDIVPEKQTAGQGPGSGKPAEHNRMAAEPVGV